MKKNNKLSGLKLEKVVVSKLTSYDSARIKGGSNSCPAVCNTNLAVPHQVGPATQVNHCHSVSITKIHPAGAALIQTGDCTMNQCKG